MLLGAGGLDPGVGPGAGRQGLDQGAERGQRGLVAGEQQRPVAVQRERPGELGGGAERGEHLPGPGAGRPVGGRPVAVQQEVDVHGVQFGVVGADREGPHPRAAVLRDGVAGPVPVHQVLAGGGRGQLGPVLAGAREVQLDLLVGPGEGEAARRQREAHPHGARGGAADGGDGQLTDRQVGHGWAPVGSEVRPSLPRPAHSSLSARCHRRAPVSARARPSARPRCGRSPCSRRRR